MTDSQASNITQPKPRTSSISQASEDSQTAAEYANYPIYMVAIVCADCECSFIKEQLSLEAEAREALPYVSFIELEHFL